MPKGHNGEISSDKNKPKALQPSKGAGVKGGKAVRLSLGGSTVKQGGTATAEEATIAGEIPLVMPAKISNAKVGVYP
jgi:hypothetical protein